MSDKYSEKYELSGFSPREEMNRFSYWWEKVKDCGMRVPRTVVIKTPEELREHFWMDNPKVDYAKIDEWVNSTVIPTLQESELYGSLLFVKNSLFSDKFNARNCFPSLDPGALTSAICNIQYDAAMIMMAGPSGEDEFVFRSRIGHDPRTTPCIYDGLPLRPEFRVFYDFDTKEVIFTAEYWNYDYCYSHLYDRTDRIVFDSMKDELHKKFEEHRPYVEELVSEHMKNVQGLEGPWSVDVMLAEETCGNPDMYYLIDMAVAERSSYWEQRPTNTKTEVE